MYMRAEIAGKFILSDKQLNIFKRFGSGETDAEIAFNLTDEGSTDENVANLPSKTWTIEVTTTGYNGA